MFKLVLFFAIVAAVSADMTQFREECRTELDIPQENIDNYSKYILKSNHMRKLFIPLN